MGIVRKIKNAARWVENVVELDAPRPAPADKPATEQPAPKEPGDAKLVRGLGERIGIAGLVAFTLGAALFGASGCREGSGTSTPATCAEPTSWCGAEAVQR